VDNGRAVLALGARLNLAAELMREHLHAVADAQDRLAGVQDVARQQRRAVGIDAGRSAGQDEALGLEGANALFWRVMRDELAVDVVLADAARDQLTVLRAEVDDGDGVAVEDRVLGRS
jgi:hypothetical protein